jgi:hypothetical protein
MSDRTGVEEQPADERALTLVVPVGQVAAGQRVLAGFELGEAAPSSMLRTFSWRGPDRYLAQPGHSTGAQQKISTGPVGFCESRTLNKIV